MPVTIDFQFSQELGTAEQAARDAGAAIMALFRGKYDVHEKSKNNPVTTADLEANRIIRERIAMTFPDDGWLSEEDADSEHRLGRARVWVVDPIDGTKEFMKGCPSSPFPSALSSMAWPKRRLYTTRRKRSFSRLRPIMALT